MVSGNSEKITDAIVDRYITDGNATKGALAFNSFSTEKVDFLADDFDVSRSPLAAGSKTYLAGALFGVHTTLQILEVADADIDCDAVVEENADAIDRSVAVGIQELKRGIVEKLVDENDLE